MCSEIIYEKKYPHIFPSAELKCAKATVSGKPQLTIPPFSELLKRATEETAYILIPKRTNAGEKFIQIAIEVSELYQLDTIIERHDSHISVTYSFNCCGGMREIKHVLSMADDFAFFTGIHGRDITVCLDYFTHAVVCKGKIVAP